MTDNNPSSTFHCLHANEARSKFDPAYSRKQGEVYGTLWKMFSCSWSCWLILPWSHLGCPRPSSQPTGLAWHLHPDVTLPPLKWSTIRVQSAAVLLFCTVWEDAHHTGTRSKSLSVTLATSCVSECPPFPPASLCPQDPVRSPGLQPKVSGRQCCFSHSFQALPFLSPCIWKPLASFSSNQKVFFKWHPVRHISPVSQTWLEMSDGDLVGNT